MERCRWAKQESGQAAAAEWRGGLSSRVDGRDLLAVRKGSNGSCGGSGGKERRGRGVNCTARRNSKQRGLTVLQQRVQQELRTTPAQEGLSAAIGCQQRWGSCRERASTEQHAHAASRFCHAITHSRASGDRRRGRRRTAPCLERRAGQQRLSGEGLPAACSGSGCSGVA